MPRFALRLLAALPLIFGAAFVAAADPPAPLDTLELNDGDTVVFLGDSITHQCLYTQYVEDFFYTRFPGKRMRFHNAGIGGARAWDALQRFDRDVAAYKPKYVTVLLGMNDGTYQPFNQAVFDTYVKDMTEVVERIKAAGATPILMTPTMYDARAARAKGKNEATQEFYNSVLAYYGTWLRDVAERNGYGFVDMWSPLNNLTIDRRETEPTFTLIEDAIHPGPSGQLVMAAAILEDLELLKPISTIRINVSGKEAKGNGTGGALSDLEKSEIGVTFTWAAESLPFVLPEEARLGAKMLKLGHRGSREALVVSGLPAGRYELLIDGETVGTYPASKFASGVELQENDKTPQYRQALKVAELNKRRNAEGVHPLRDAWRVFQQYARAKREAAEKPETAGPNENLKKLEEVVAGLEEKIAKHEADAKAIEDEIFRANQPKPHSYELRRTAGEPRQANAAGVSGTVTLDGRPVGGAEVVFVGESGVKLSGKTNAEGRYRFPEAAPKPPTGTYTVIFRGDGLPANFTDAKTSSLRANLAAGNNIMDFDLRRER